MRINTEYNGHKNNVGFGARCKETGQYRKGEPASKPQNTNEFKSILGLQKCPVCPFCVNVVS